MRVSFGDFVFDGQTRELLRGETKLHVPPKTFRMLEILLDRRPNAVSKDALMEALWPGVFVAEGNLARIVAELRGIVGDDAQEPRVIRTVPRFGYAFQAEACVLPAAPPNGASRGRSRAGRGVLAAALLLAAGFWAGRLVERGRTPAPLFHRLTFGRGLVRAARFAPDGHTVVYSAQWDGRPARVFQSRLGSPESQALPLGDATELLGVSRGGELALGLKAPRFPRLGAPAATLATMPLAGAAPRELLADIQSADWSPHGNGLAIVRAGRLEFPAGTRLYGDGHVGKAVFSPRGDRIAFLEVRGGDTVVSAVDLRGRRTELAPFAPALGPAAPMGPHVGIAWNGKGDEVWYAGGVPGRSNAVMAASLTGRTRVLIRMSSYAAVRDVSRDGRLLLTMGDFRGSVVFHGPGDGEERELGWFSMSAAADLARDGSAILLNEFGEGESRDGAAYLRRTDGSPAVKVAEGRAQSLSPDASWVARVRDGRADLIPTGPGEPRALSAPGFHYESLAWFPDGKRFLVTGRADGRPPRLWVQDASGGPLRPLSTEGVTGNGRVSPDGTRVVVRQPDGLWVYSVARGDRRPVPAVSGDEIVLNWTEDGEGLLVAEMHRLPVEIVRLDGATGRREPWKSIAPRDAGGICSYDLLVLPNGAWVLNSRRWTSDLYLVEGVR